MLIVEQKPWYKKNWFIISVLIAVIAVIFFYFYWSEEQLKEFRTEATKRMDIEQIVSVTGKVNADPQVDLNFQTQGKIVGVFVDVGDIVEAGDVLAELENDDQEIALERAKAELSNAEAELAKQLAGSKSEEIKVAEAQVRHSENDVRLKELELSNTKKISAENVRSAELQKSEADIALEKAEINLENTQITVDESIKAAEKELEAARVALNKADIELQNTIVTTDKSIDDNYERLYIAINDSLLTISKNLLEADKVFGVKNPTLNDEFERILGAYDFNNMLAGERAFAQAEGTYNEVNKKFSAIAATDKDEVQDIYIDAERALTDADLLMEKASIMVDSVVPNQFFTVADRDSLKDRIHASHTNLKLAKDNVASKYHVLTSALLNTSTLDEEAKAAYEVAQNNFEVAGQNLNKVKAEGTSQIEAAESDLKQAVNVVGQAEQNLSAAVIDSENKISQAGVQKDLSQTALAQARANLALVRSGPREVDVRSLRATIEQAKANIKAAEYTLSKTKIVAPVGGIISKLNIEEGEVYSGATSTESGFLAPVVSIIAEQLQVEADVSETDIAKVKLNDSVSMTFDAFAISEEFKGTVSHIDPAETVISGVVYYKVETAFDIEYEKIKSGMTANLDILTDQRDQVIGVPIRGVIFGQGDTGKVKVLVNGREVEKEIMLGLEGETYIEVVRGLAEGEEIIMNSNGG